MNSKQTNTDLGVHLKSEIKEWSRLKGSVLTIDLSKIEMVSIENSREGNDLLLYCQPGAFPISNDWVVADGFLATLRFNKKLKRKPVLRHFQKREAIRLRAVKLCKEIQESHSRYRPILVQLA